MAGPVMMNEEKYTYRVQRWALGGAALLVLLLILAWVVEGRGKEWRHLQREYEALLVDLSGDPAAGRELEKGIFQVELPQFKRNDRCISCHFGLEDERMAGLGAPHGKHPGAFLEEHPVDAFGCTLCHGGQPQALNKDDAHGREGEAHWPLPMLEQPYIQSSCGKCHLAIFDGEATAAGAMPGMDVFSRGKEVFSREGCLGCHKARGVGGILGPDLTEQGEKTRHEYSFQNVRGEQSVSQWLKEHFRDPEMVSPGSQMLRIDLEEEELDALATFVMGLAKPDIPFDYFAIETLNEFKGIRDSLSGKAAYAQLCSSCHGKKGEGKSYEEYQTGIPGIGRPDFIRVASRDFIRYTLEKGRSQRQMGSWTPGISGLHVGEVDSLAAYLDGQMPGMEHVQGLALSGRTTEGLALFERHCQSCHGEQGKGGIAVALNQPSFLSMASREYLLRTLVSGRSNTAMPAWTHLEGKELVDLVAGMESWRTNPGPAAAVILPRGDPREGAQRYHFLCSRCHGEFGQGETGPAIINRDFLDAADEDFLYRTIAEGRSHTAMFGWSSEVVSQESLGKQDISNLIAFMKEEAQAPLTYLRPGSNPGDHSRGSTAFERRCARCHGEEGSGIKAPALNNQEFLSAASNGYLMATITIGRQGTAMPAWGYDRAGEQALGQEEREDLVAHLRAWQRIRIKY